MKPEYCSCDSLKQILLACGRLILVDRWQTEDILAVIKYDLSSTKSLASPRARPKAPKGYWGRWTSDDSYTRNGPPKMGSVGEALDVILHQCLQLRKYDGLNDGRILAIIESDIRRHFVEVDV